MSYLVEISTRVSGIPCLIGVTSFHRVRGSYAYNAPSDLDYSGYTESDWEVLDRNGRRASWLHRKLTKADIDRIESAICEAME